MRTAQVCGGERERTLRARALGEVLDGRPWSRRRLASLVGVDEKFVRRWCSGDRPIPEDRLRRDAPIVWARWRARLDELDAERRAA